MSSVRVGYSRISDIQQAATDPLAQAEHELRKAGAELVLVEVGSGTDDLGGRSSASCGSWCSPARSLR